MKKLISYLLILSLLIINFKSTEVQAAELAGGQGYSGSYSYTYDGRCGGFYINTGIKNLVPGSDELMLGHTHWCLEYGDTDCQGFPAKNASYKNIQLYDTSTGTFYTQRWCYYVWDYCEGGSEEWHCEHCSVNGSCGTIHRYGEVYYRCQKCGKNNTIKGDNGVLFENETCPENYHGTGVHVFRGGYNSGCYYCGKSFRNLNGAACQAGGTWTISGTWNNTVDYTFKNTAGSKSATSTSPSVICDYNSNATITFNIGNPIESYTLYKNGVAIETVTSSDAASGVSQVTTTQTVTGFDSYQLKFKVLAGNISTDILTSPIYLISGVQIYVEDTIVDSGYTSQSLTNWKVGTEFVNGTTTTKSDLSVGDRVNKQDKNIPNIGIFKITNSAYGGNDEKIGPGITDTNYLFAWSQNATYSTTTSTAEPYPGSGRIATVNHYYPGYYYVRESSPMITSNKQLDEDNKMYRYFKPITYTAKFINAYGTSYKGDTTNYNKTWTMPNMTFTYDRGQKLSANQYVRKYYVTLANQQPWLNSQTNNSASRWVEYSFVGWKQGNTPNGTSPYYEVTSTTDLYTDQEAVGNLTTINNSTVNLQATWKSNTITLPNTVTGSNNYVFINWSHKPYPDNRVYDKTITNNLDDVNYIVNKNTGYKPYKDTILYAHWYKDLTLTFNLNGGKYNGNAANITLEGTIYDYEPYYTFNITSGLTAQSRGHYDKQINSIDAYGTYSMTDGTNTKYTKIDSEGTVYRFLGWSTNKDAIVPDAELDVYSTTRGSNYSISENTTLYAVWEKVLTADINWLRPLGNFKLNKIAARWPAEAVAQFFYFI